MKKASAINRGLASFVQAVVIAIAVGEITLLAYTTMKDLGILAVSLGTSVLLGFGVSSALKKGVVCARGTSVSVNDHPVTFWLLVGIYALLGTFCLLLSVCLVVVLVGGKTIFPR